MLLKKITNTLLSFTFIMLNSAVQADDSDIYFSDGSFVNPNILFVLDASGSMSQAVPGDLLGRDRMKVMQDSFEEVLDAVPPFLNVGLMNFSGHRKGDYVNGPSFPVSPIDDPALPIVTSNLIPTNLKQDGHEYRGMFDVNQDNIPEPADSTVTVRDFLKQIGHSWNHSGITPIADSLYEAARYYRGEEIDWGKHVAPDERAAHPSTYAGYTYEERPISTNQWKTERSSVLSYKSPIDQNCQKNFIVLLSDGGPYLGGRDATKKGKALGKIKQLAKKSACEAVDVHLDKDDKLKNYKKGYDLSHGLCGPELTEALATEDQIDDSILPEKQIINTYTIGFGLNQDSAEEAYLKLLAKKGEGSYFAAKNSDSLVKAFNDVLSEIGSTSSSFASPVYSVNESTQFSHKDDVYLPVFSASIFPRWSGNLKKLKLENGQLQGVAKPGDMTSMIAAVDEIGAFVDGVSDLWSKTEKDGGNITAGGVANLLEAANRKLYSNLTSDQNVDLTSAANHINTDNVAGYHLGVDLGDTDYISKLVSFIKGYEDDGATSRYHMGDIMHSKPVVVSHGTKQTIFVATNEGYLHAFDADTGKERFAFMPKDLLKNIEKQYLNNEPKSHVYGLDGEITVWKHDVNKDGKINGSEDFVYLFFGMRRGGRNVYAMDVTDVDRPKLLWKIAGGEGQFTELGQTWSKPSLVKLHSPNESDKGKLIDVLVFGGGYDPALDEEDVSARVKDIMGRAVYIVDAKTGKLIWSDEISFDHSIPSEIRILDMDKNGSIDRLYFSDTGGNLWRADLDIDIRDGYGGSASTLYNITKTRVSKFAELGGTGSDKRKFFNEPDISLVKHDGKKVLLISIGSGYRSRPLNNAIDDRLYVLIDEDISTLPSTTFSILENDLVNIETLSGESIITKKIQEKQAGNDIKGWYYNMPNTGEKVLAASRTFLGKVMFTTFASDGKSADSCTTPPSTGRAYVLNVLTGEAALDLNRDGNIDQSPDDKSVVAGSNEILGTPQLVFSAPKAVDGGVCTESDCRHYVNIRVGKKLTPIGDRDNSNDDDPISSLDLGKILPRSYWLDHNAVER